MPEASFSKLYLSAHGALDGPIVDHAGGGEVFEGETLAGEEGHVLRSLTPSDLSGDDLAQLVDRFGEDDAGFEGVQQVSGFEAELFARVHADEARAPDDVAVDLA